MIFMAFRLTMSHCSFTVTRVISFAVSRGPEILRHMRQAATLGPLALQPPALGRDVQGRSL